MEISICSDEIEILQNSLTGADQSAMIGNQLLDVGLHWPVDGQSGATSTVFVHVYTIPDSSCAGTKNISDRAFIHTQNADFGLIFVPG